MTAEQLEELQRFVNRADNDDIDGFDGCNPYWAASLARRVIAAEKLVEALDAVREMATQDVGEQIEADTKLEAALTAYREASK